MSICDHGKTDEFSTNDSCHVKGHTTLACSEYWSNIILIGAVMWGSNLVIAVYDCPSLKLHVIDLEYSCFSYDYIVNIHISNIQINFLTSFKYA